MCFILFWQPLTLDEMRLSEGGGGGSLSLASFEPEFMRPIPPMLPIADSEVRVGAGNYFPRSRSQMTRLFFYMFAFCPGVRFAKNEGVWANGKSRRALI